MQVIRELETAGVPDMLGRDWIFVTVHDAVSFCSRQLAEAGVAATPLSITQQPSSTSDSDE